MNTPSPRFELLDHTADVGLRIFGDSLGELFESAAFGLLSTIVEELPSLSPTASTLITLSAPDDRELLVDWLNDRLFRFDARQEIHAWPEVRRVGDGVLEAISGYLPIDWARHRFHAEVKSATYHGLRLERMGEGWVAEVIFDL